MSMNDPGYVNERQWGAAIAQWFDHDGAAVAALVMSNAPIPTFAREFLSDLATGRVNRGKGGRPEKRFGQVERAIVFDVFVEWEKTSKEAAIDAVQEKRKTPIRPTVNKLRKQGITLERWQAWGRPDWSIR